MRVLWNIALCISWRVPEAAGSFGFGLAISQPREPQDVSRMRKDIPQLHAIRALAMAAIFFHHLWQGLPRLNGPYQGTALNEAFVDMALGVVVFNALTAFLAGLPYFGPDAAAPPAFFASCRKRLARLYPQYVLAVVGLTGVSVLVFHLRDFSGLARGALSHLLFLDTFQTTPFYSNMAAYWWLGLLFQFTLATPWLVRLSVRTRFGPGGWCLFSAAVLWPVTAWIQAKGAALPGTSWESFAFLWTFNLPARLPEFWCGLWMAKTWREQGDGRVWPFGRGLALFLGGGILGCTLWSWLPGVPSLGHMTGAVWSLGVFAALFALPLTSRLGRMAATRRISALSYGIYLAHQPILSYCEPVLAGFAPWPRFAVQAIVAGSASFVCAWLLERGATFLTAPWPPRRPV